MFPPGAISSPWCCGLAVGSHSSCQVVVTVQLLSPGPAPRPRPGGHSGSAVSGPNDTASLLVSSGLFTLLHSPPEPGDVPSDLCQTLSDYNIKHRNSLLRNKVCSCFLKSHTNTLFQIHFPHLSHEQVKFLRGWLCPPPHTHMETCSLLLLGLWPLWGNSLHPQEQLAFAPAPRFCL